MWLVQTPVSGLSLPVDTEGRLTLAGQVPAWNHIVRSRGVAPSDAEQLLSAMPVRWEILPWYESANKIYFHGSTQLQHRLLDAVREHKYRAITLATFPSPGKRQSDSVLQLSLVVPPAHFAQYESLLRFAMTMPVGTVSMTLPTPVADHASPAADATRELFTSGTSCVTEGVELTISRAIIGAYSEDDLHPEQRISQVSKTAENVDDENYADWFHFRRDDG